MKVKILELTCQHNFSRYKDKQHNSWFHHSINEARKQFRFITVKIPKKEVKKIALFNYLFEIQYTEAVVKSHFTKNLLAILTKVVLSVLGNFCGSQ